MYTNYGHIKKVKTKNYIGSRRTAGRGAVVEIIVTNYHTNMVAAEWKQDVSISQYENY